MYTSSPALLRQTLSLHLARREREREQLFSLLELNNKTLGSSQQLRYNLEFRLSPLFLSDYHVCIIFSMQQQRQQESSNVCYNIRLS